MGKNDVSSSSLVKGAKKIPVSITVDASLLSKARLLSAFLGMSFSCFVESMLEKEIGRRDDLLKGIERLREAEQADMEE